MMAGLAATNEQVSFPWPARGNKRGKSASLLANPEYKFGGRGTYEPAIPKVPDKRHPSEDPRLSIRPLALLARNRSLADTDTLGVGRKRILR